MWVVVFALTAAIAWGWAFPLIKVGFIAFGITADMTGGKMLFAGIRFAAAGLIVLSVARSSGRSFKMSKAAIKQEQSDARIDSAEREQARPKVNGSDWQFILAFALMNTPVRDKKVV